MSDGAGVLLLVGDGAAASLSGQAAVLGGSSLLASVTLNTTGLAVDEQIGEQHLELAAGNYLRVAVVVPSVSSIDIGPVSLSGAFVFQAGADSVLITVTDGVFQLGSVTIEDVNGSFEWNGTNFAGSLAGHVRSELLPAVQINGTVALEFDSTGVTGLPSALTITIDGYELGGTVEIGEDGADTTFTLTNGHIEVGPVSAHIPSIEITIGTGGHATASITNAVVAVNTGGFQLNGTVSIAIDTGAADGDPKVTVSVTPSLVKIGDVTIHSGASPPGLVTLERTDDAVAVTLTDFEITFEGFTATVESGSFRLSANGLAGSLTVSLTESLTSFTIETGTVRLELNTFPFAIDSPTLPAGPFVRVVAIGLKIKDGPVDLTLDAYFEHSAQMTVVGVRNLEIKQSGNTILSDGRGALVVANGGIAGVASGTTDFGPVSVSFNYTGQTVETAVEFEGESFVIDFDTTGPAINITGATVDLDLGGFVRLQGSVSFSLVNGRHTFGAVNATLYVGDGPYIVMRDARVAVIRTGAGTVGDPYEYAAAASGTIELQGVSGVSFSATGTITFNNTGQDVDHTVTVSTPGGPVAIRVLAASGAQRFETTSLTVEVAGQRLTGAASFESVDVDGDTALDVTFTDVDLRLANGLVVVNDADGALRFGPDGVTSPRRAVDGRRRNAESR